MTANKKACVIVAEQILSDLEKLDFLVQAFKSMDESQQERIFSTINIALLTYSYALCYKSEKSEPAILCSDRLPSQDDADQFGHVLAFDKIWWPTNYMTLRMCPDAYSHWAPTKIKAPDFPSEHGSPWS